MAEAAARLGGSALDDESLESLGALPGVTDAGVVTAMPFIGANINIEASVTIEGRAPDGDWHPWRLVDIEILLQLPDGGATRIQVPDYPGDLTFPFTEVGLYAADSLRWVNRMPYRLSNQLGTQIRTEITTEGGLALSDAAQRKSVGAAVERLRAAGVRTALLLWDGSDSGWIEGALAVIGLLLLFFFPQIALWLPNLLYGR